MKRTYGKKKRPYVASFSDSPESTKKKTNRTATPNSQNDTIDDLAELLLDDTMEGEKEQKPTVGQGVTSDVQIPPKRNKLKDVARVIKGAVSKKLSSKKRERSIYSDKKPLLSDSQNENVATEGEDDDSTNSGRSKKSEGLTEIYVKRSKKPNTIPRKPLVSDEVSTAYDASLSDVSPPLDTTGTTSTKGSILTGDSFHEQDSAQVTQHRTSTYAKLFSDSPDSTTRDDASGMDTMDSSSSVHAPNSQLRRQLGAITVNTDEILTSSPAAQSTPNGLRHHHPRYPGSQSHLRNTSERSASRNTEGTLNLDLLTPTEARISTKRNPAPSPDVLQSYGEEVLAMLELTPPHLAPPTMSNLEAPRSSPAGSSHSGLQGAAITGHATPALGDRSVNTAIGQRIQDGAQLRQGLAHSGSFPARLNQHRSKASTGNDKKDAQPGLMENDGSEDELQTKDPRYDLSKKGPGVG